MRYATAAAFRQALDDRLKAEAAKTGLGLARLRKRVAFELFLRRLVSVAADRWVLKGALALDFRFDATSRTTRDMDLGRADDEEAAVEDLAAAQQLALDDYFTFVVRRTDALDDTDDFRAIRFHVTANLAGRVFDLFVVDIVRRLNLVEAGRDRDLRPTLLRRHRARSRPGSAAPSARRGEGARVHAQVRRDSAREHPTEGPGRHPPDRQVGAIRRRGSTRALEATFEQREQQPLPSSLPAPPASWREPYDRLAAEVAIEPELDKAFAEAAAFLDPILADRAGREWDPQRKTWA